jgi:quercetin dioxygenase-like cupin family protein
MSQWQTLTGKAILFQFSRERQEAREAGVAAKEPFVHREDIIPNRKEQKMSEAKTGKPGATGEIVKTADEIARLEVRAGNAAVSQVLLGEKEGVPNFFMRRFTMGKGGGMPLHTNTVEHEQYVLRGRARVGIGDRVYEVKADDILYIPAGMPHYYEVIEAPFQFLCLVPNRPDQVEILGAG